MADRIKPQAVERVKKIRAWELNNKYREAQHIKGFKKYKNYFVPESIVKGSKTVLSFGVGGDVGFEKEIAFDNTDLQIELFDPTPRSVNLIQNIINLSSYKLVGKRSDDPVNVQAVKRINFQPVAYSKENGYLPFYYDPTREDGRTAKEALQSFSLIKREEHYESVNVKAKTLRTIMSELKMTSVDIIKADIEGLWWEFGHEILDNNIDCKFVALELELNFEEDEKVEPALDKAQLLCDKFQAKNYDVIINRLRDKLMLEMLFVRKDAYEG
jgi:FkbM family methyltransferase|tara:strand:+ start:777 stop:1589 length:813 start_codon:yes stop_codon:yes gene_type:complete